MKQLCLHPEMKWCFSCDWFREHLVFSMKLWSIKQCECLLKYSNKVSLPCVGLQRTNLGGSSMIAGCPLEMMLCGAL